jgi:hypothetical protein
LANLLQPRAARPKKRIQVAIGSFSIHHYLPGIINPISGRVRQWNGDLNSAGRMNGFGRRFGRSVREANHASNGSLVIYLRCII